MKEVVKKFIEISATLPSGSRPSVKQYYDGQGKPSIYYIIIEFLRHAQLPTSLVHGIIGSYEELISNKHLLINDAYIIGIEEGEEKVGKEVVKKICY